MKLRLPTERRGVPAAPPWVVRFVHADWCTPTDAYPAVAARSRWGKACRAWADDNGWTRAQMLGLHHPDWIAQGWATVPPGAAHDRTHTTSSRTNR